MSRLQAIEFTLAADKHVSCGFGIRNVVPPKSSKSPKSGAPKTLQITKIVKRIPIGNQLPSSPHSKAEEGRSTALDKI